MRIALDAMGGDHAPREVILGAQLGLSFLGPDDGLMLYGPSECIATQCRELGVTDPRIQIESCTQTIHMDEPPVEALRQKRDSSIYRMAVDAEQGRVDALISAGNTGAFAAACQLKIGVIPGVSRPGIAVAIPTFYGPVLVCDVGANVSPKPRHLHEYARMCRCYARQVLQVADPRIGLVSIGEEEVKGNLLVKEARALIKNDPRLHYAGNMEGRDIFAGLCDVVICDGFVGNVILKLTEGLAEGLFRTIVHEIKEASPELTPRFEPIVANIWKRHDFAEYGGAPLLGVNSIVIICHGRSDRRAISNAIRVAKEQQRVQLNELIAEEISQPQPEGAA
jgi:glycerol-3-phosphate acyltransferase PlsX